MEIKAPRFVVPATSNVSSTTISAVLLGLPLTVMVLDTFFLPGSGNKESKTSNTQGQRYMGLALTAH